MSKSKQILILICAISLFVTHRGVQTAYAEGARTYVVQPGDTLFGIAVRHRISVGAYNRPDYYFLEDVPWTMYFNKDVALHTAYWHDGFGYKHSHGCVNLAPPDAKWLFGWASGDVWVWVHSD